MASQFDPNVCRWVVSNHTGRGCCIPAAAAAADFGSVEVMTEDETSIISAAELVLLVLSILLVDIFAYISLMV